MLFPLWKDKANLCFSLPLLQLFPLKKLERLKVGSFLFKLWWLLGKFSRYGFLNGWENLLEILLLSIYFLFSKL